MKTKLELIREVLDKQLLIEPYAERIQRERNLHAYNILAKANKEVKEKLK